MNLQRSGMTIMKEFEVPPIDPNASVRKLPLLGTVPGVCGGDPIILGTRITCVQMWIYVRRLGMTVMEILDEFPHLNYEQVSQAIQFVDEHPGYILEHDDWWAENGPKEK